jgi:Predicted transcriptional regulator
MYILKKIRMKKMIPLVKEILDRGGKVRMEVHGESMLPFLNRERDHVELSSIEYSELRRGDMAFYIRDSGEYVLHRVIRKRSSQFFVVGDSQQWVETLRPDQLIAVAKVVWRSGRCIDCSKLWWRALVEVWMLLRPFRRYIFRSYRLYKRLFNVNYDVKKVSYEE